SAGIRLALSIPLMVAPAFVASLFGDRVQSVLMIQNRMLAVVDVLVPPQDSCLAGKCVQAVAIDYSLLPVAVYDPAGKLESQPMTVHLAAGHRLVIISALPDLQRLLRREPVRAEFAVDLTAFPPSSRSQIVSVLCRHQGLRDEDAHRVLDR